MSGSTTDEEADLTPEQRFELEQSRHRQTREKMKQLVSHFGTISFVDHHLIL